jgi:fibronectin type 3 domain-containing protein
MPKVSLEMFKDKAELKALIRKEEFPVYEKRKEKDSVEYEYQYELAKESLTLKRLTFGLRIKDEKKKASEFSKLVSAEPGIVPLPPQDVQYTVYKDRIDIEWKEPEKNIDDSTPAKVQGYIVYKKEEEELPRALNSSLIKENKYSDKDFMFGKVYHYFIRASSTESSPFLESNESETIEVLAKDIFAPEAPTGLVSMAGGDFISLSWDVNQEKDLLGYRVWRREEEQEEYTLLTPEPVRENVYSDTTVEKNKRYYYAITALDENKNESQKSEAVSEMIEGQLS